MVSGADASRTIGWLTSLFPFVLSVDPQRQVGFQLKSVKEAIRAVPSHGIGYGLLRYLENAQLEARPQVSFNYLGQPRCRAFRRAPAVFAGRPSTATSALMPRHSRNSR